MKKSMRKGLKRSLRREGEPRVQRGGDFLMVKIKGLVQRISDEDYPYGKNPCL